MKIRHFLLLVVVVMSSLVFGCEAARSDMDYLSAGGRGEVRGEMSGAAFCAAIEIGERGERVRVEYLSPTSLCGLVLVAEGERCEVSLGEMNFSCSTAEMAGFLRPVSAFLPQEDANSVQREGKNTVLSFSSGGTLTLSPSGDPLSLSREDITMQVVWWQSGGEEISGS